MFLLGFVAGFWTGLWWAAWLRSLYQPPPEPDDTADEADAYVRRGPLPHWPRNGGP